MKYLSMLGNPGAAEPRPPPCRFLPSCFPGLTLPENQVPTFIRPSFGLNLSSNTEDDRGEPTAIKNGKNPAPNLFP
jgi:hypothetical protein